MHGHESAHCIPRALCIALSAAALALACLSCRGMLEQADLEEFVDTGLTNVLVRSTTFSPGSEELRLIPSGKTITCTVAIINPKSLDVTYSLGWDISNSSFIAFPSKAPGAKDATELSFDFALEPLLAEHQTVTFTLGKYVASINKTYDSESFSIVCDSPPNAAARLSAVVAQSDQKSVLAILLPSRPGDDDLSKLRISWTKEGGSSTSSDSFAISSLRTPISGGSFSGAYSCYFQSSDCEANYGYAYSVVVIDEVGQESSAVDATSAANFFPLNYDGNGSTGGAPPASNVRRTGSAVTVAGPGDLARAGYGFTRWDTKPKGGGTDYAPGEAFNGATGMPAYEVTLYAQWATTGLTIEFGLSGQGLGLSFNPSSATYDLNSPISIVCGNAKLSSGGSNWRWYKDGVRDDSQLSGTFSWKPTLAAEIGMHVISCLVDYLGSTYSGQLRLTIED